MLRRIMLLTVLACAIQGASIAVVKEVKGVIGDTDISFKAQVISTKASYTREITGSGSLLCVSEVYPDSPSQPRYTYDVYQGKRLIYKRDYIGKGFGRVSFFISPPKGIANSRRIRFVNTGVNPVRIAGVRSVSESELAGIEKKDTFGLFGLLSSYQGEEAERKWAAELASGLPKAKGIYRGFSTEIPYAAWDQGMIAAQIDRHVRYAKEYGLSYFPSLVSWWAATPLGIPDGEGGHFGDIKYQQICWSPDDNADEGPELRALLGDRWNIHYGLSIPNEWSNVPWLTMNSPTLNSYRHGRLGWALGALTDRVSKSGIDLAGVYLENEPRYWDTVCEAANPKRQWKTCWADFNPFVISDAKKDGVNIDPSDGLDYKERMWLHRNVARYNQDAVDQALASLKSSKMDKDFPVYAHSLQLRGFPGDEIGHAMSEWAYVKGGYTGLEGIWTKLSDFDRVREWGPWANLNREEGDGREIREHLWDLRTAYARGGRLFNSYNWNTIGAQRVFDYMKEFLDNLPTVKLVSPDFRKESALSASFVMTPDVQGLNVIRLRINAAERIGGGVEVIVRNPEGMIIGYTQSNKALELGSNGIEFVFSEPFELIQGERGTISVSKTGDLRSSGLDIQSAEFRFDLRRERTQSLYVIGHAHGG